MKRVVLGLLVVFLAATVGLAIYFSQVPDTMNAPMSPPASPPAAKAPPATKAAPAAKVSPPAKTSPPAKAPSGEASMRGLNPIIVLVEELPPAAKVCGIRREVIQVAAELALSQSPLRIVTSVADAKGYLYIQVNVIAADKICATNIYASFRAGAVVRENNQLTIADIWNESMLGAAWPAEAPQKVQSAVGTLTGKFIETWKRENR